jgi:hypothetical protein
MRTSACTLAVLALCLVTAVHAGDYRNGHKSPQRDPATLSYNYVPVEPLKRHEVEKNFNWCDKDGLDLCTASWNQHIPQYCGSCWAHGTLAAIQDRLKIRKGGKGMDVMLARQVLLNCGAFDNFGAGCDGGDVIDAFHYMTKYGLPDESCQLYNATDHTKFGKDVKECPAIAKCMNCMPINGTDTCWPVETPILYKLKSYGKLKHGSELGMMAEIRKNGPITCSIATPDDMVYDYRGGIMLATDFKKSEVDHDIEVVGWGEEDGIPFWHIRNSWGTFWGELGFFRLERGTNALQIEEGDCWAAEPEHHMEDEVRDGELLGTMYGLVENDGSRARKAARTVAAASSAGVRKAAGIIRKMRGFVSSA